jgi:hypothetical protein
LKRFAIALTAVLTLNGSVQAEGDAKFPTIEAIREWGRRTSLGYREAELHYKELRLLVVIRDHTSGVYSADPSVFMAQGDTWYRIFNPPPCTMCRIRFEIRENFLVFLVWDSGSSPDTARESARINLDELRVTIRK